MPRAKSGCEIEAAITFCSDHPAAGPSRICVASPAKTHLGSSASPDIEESTARGAAVGRARRSCIASSIRSSRERPPPPLVLWSPGSKLRSRLRFLSTIGCAGKPPCRRQHHTVALKLVLGDLIILVCPAAPVSLRLFGLETGSSGALRSGLSPPSTEQRAHPDEGRRHNPYDPGVVLSRAAEATAWSPRNMLKRRDGGLQRSLLTDLRRSVRSCPGRAHPGRQLSGTGVRYTFHHSER